MKSSQLPDQILSKMSPKDRRKLGLQTSDEAQATFVAKSERELQNQIANLLRLRGIWFCQSRMDRPTTQRKGVPDFICAMNGNAVAFEVKFANGKLKPEQEQTHAEMKKNGWDVWVVRSLEQLKQIMDTFYLAV